MKSKIKLLTLLLSLLCLANCNSIEPPVNGNGQDTTSHNFSWQSWTFGEHSSSLLYDVAIISKNNIWAVGEIYLNDSLGQADPTPYNAVKWDGTTWIVKRIPTKTFSGTTVSSQIRTIFAFNENDIWTFSIAGSYSHWNGNNWETEFVSERGGSGNKLWGSDASNLYLVGNNGSISHYNGTSWQKLESGTDVDIHDIWGSVDNGTGEQTMLAVASFQNYGFGLDLLKIDGLSASKLDTAGLRIAQSSVWFKGSKNIYVVGDGVFFKNNLSDARWQQDETHPLLFKRRIRGQDWNDIFIVGDFGLVSHHNGKTWYHYRGKELPNLNGSYYSVSFSGNIVTAVGDLDNGQAIILRGDR